MARESHHQTHTHTQKEIKTMNTTTDKLSPREIEIRRRLGHGQSIKRHQVEEVLVTQEASDVSRKVKKDWHTTADTKAE